MDMVGPWEKRLVELGVLLNLQQRVPRKVPRKLPKQPLQPGAPPKPPKPARKPIKPPKRIPSKPQQRGAGRIRSRRALSALDSSGDPGLSAEGRTIQQDGQCRGIRKTWSRT